MSKELFSLAADIEQVEMAPGILRRTMGTLDELMICEFTAKAGGAIPTHDHPHHQVGYVVAGQLEFTIDGDTRIVNAGDSYAVPGGVPHSARVIEDAVIVEAFTPAREDYR